MLSHQSVKCPDRLQTRNEFSPHTSNSSPLFPATAATTSSGGTGYACQVLIQIAVHCHSIPHAEAALREEQATKEDHNEEPSTICRELSNLAFAAAARQRAAGRNRDGVTEKLRRKLTTSSTSQRPQHDSTNVNGHQRKATASE